MCAFRCMSRIVLRTRRRWANLSTRRWCRWTALPVAPSKPSDGSTGRSSTASNRWESLATMFSITLRESPTENWGIRGGQAACDVDLGFNVKV